MRLTDAAGLFRHVIPFLASEHGLFRTAAVTALGCIHQSVFNTLLTTLQSITRHIYDEARSKVPATRPSFSRTRDQERLHTAVAQVYQLTAHFVKDPRSLDGQSALKQLLQFVRETTTYLCNPAVRNDWEQQRLRRYFCGVVEHLFDGLSTLQDSDRFLQPNMRLSLYRLCEEWCAYGPLSDSVRQRLDIMSAAAPAAWTTQRTSRRPPTCSKRRPPFSPRLRLALWLRYAYVHVLSRGCCSNHYSARSILFDRSRASLTDIRANRNP
jgi:hypothetical protein